MRHVSELHFRCNRLDLFLNKKIKAVAKCGECGKEFTTTIKSRDVSYINCPYCDCANEISLTSMEVNEIEED